MDVFASHPGTQLAGSSAGVLLPAAGSRNQTLGSSQIGPEVQIFSSSLGAMVSLLAKLRSLLVSAEDQLPEPLKSQKDKLELLRQDLDAIYTSLVNLSWVEAPNLMVKHWMNEVRDLSYDIEDYIDKMMHPGHISREEPCSDNEVEGLSTLVKQAKDAHERHNRYDLGRWASNPRFVVDEQGRVPIPRVNEEASILVGIDDSKAELIKRLNIDAEQRLVISIQGPPGVGKTTLAKQVYCEIEGQFECRAFVRASKMPDTRRLLSSIISQIVPQHQGPRLGLHVQELIDSLRNHLQQKRYLIVIDGLWETTSWDIVNSAFPDDTHCSRILITTDIEEVALECCDYESDAIFKMEPLVGNYSTELFFNRVFRFKDECSEQLKKNSEEIIRRCGGLPLAIITVASILAIQPDNLKLWRHVKEALFSRLRYNLTFEVMLREIVGLSYNILPHHLRACLLYLTMFPEGHSFLKADVVKQWSAEGFIIAVEEKNCDDVAECYFEELICRGLIQPSHTNISEEVISYAVHSTVFEVSRNMSTEENFTTVIDYSNTISELSAKVRRLSLRFSSAKYATKPENIALSPVRSLIFYGLVECLPSIKQFEVLRVLILEVWGDNHEELDLSGIDRLFQLRYMQITSNITVKLPARMIGLTYLQTLEIYARVTSVPSDIVHLPRLVHLRVGGQINLCNGIGHMGSLRTLQSFDLSSYSEDNVWQLGGMTDLHDLHVISSTEMSDPLKRKLIAFVSSLEKLGNLKSIILAPASAPSAACTNISLDCSWQSKSPLSIFIQKLELLPPFCIFSRLPLWIGQLRKLCILKIVLRELMTGDVDSIAKLQELTILSLYVRQPTAEQIVFHRATFPVLKFFKVRCGIMRIAFEPEAMPRLRSLNLEFNAHTGEQNGNMLAGIEHLLNLQEITGRVGAAPGAEESDRIAVESVFKDAISKHSRLRNFNLRIVGLFDEEWHKKSELDEVAAVVQEVSQSNDASSTPKQVFITPLEAISNTDRRSWDDGYIWRKYSDKQVNVSESPRSYYKCAFPGCPVKKKVERSQDGQITEIVYKGTHKHPQPQKVAQLLQSGGSELFEHTLSGMSAITTVATSSFGSNVIKVSSPQAENSSGDEFDEQEADSKLWIARFDDAPASSSGSVEEFDRHSMDGCTSELDEEAAVESNSASSTPKQVLRPWDDGYNWRKYGQKAVKGTEYPHSYYKCTFPSCPVKKKVERSQDGQITKIMYKGTHNHARWLENVPQQLQSGDASEHSMCRISAMPAVTLEDLALIGDDNVGVGLPWAEDAGDDKSDKDQPDSKRRKDSDGEGISMSGSRMAREPRIIVRTVSDVDILDDGYRWRKYAHKVVKGNLHPRSYYKCATVGCPVRKHVDRAADDVHTVVTTYEGKHNHDDLRGSAALYHPAAPPADSDAQNLAADSATQPTVVDQLGQPCSAIVTQKTPQLLQSGDASEHSLGGMSGPGTPVATAEGALVSIADDDVGVDLLQAGNAGSDEFDKDQPDFKRRKDSDGVGISMRPGNLPTQQSGTPSRARCHPNLTVPMPQREITTSFDGLFQLLPVPAYVVGPTPPGVPAFPTAAAQQQQQQPPPVAELERVRCIGSGASGTVWMVRHRGTQQLYALKVLYGNHDDVVRRQITREIAILRTAEHPAVVRCHGMYEHGVELQILLEYMDNGSLDGRRITAEPFLAHVARQVLSGIAYLHRRHIVHLDIKPSNLLIDTVGHVKIADFGVSRIFSSTMDPSNSSVGTIAYMSPEQINTDLNVGGNNGYAGDIWSFGLSILELYLGRFPFGENLGKQGDRAKLMCAICYSDSPEPPSTASPEFRGFISCCLQKNPAKRLTAMQLLQHPFVNRPQPQPLAAPPPS